MQVVVNVLPDHLFTALSGPLLALLDSHLGQIAYNVTPSVPSWAAANIGLAVVSGSLDSPSFFI